MEEKKCPVCGTVNDGNAKFCVGCAAEFALHETVETVESAPESVQESDDLSGESVTGEFVDTPVQEPVQEPMDEPVEEQPEVETAVEAQPVEPQAAEPEESAVTEGVYEAAPIVPPIPEPKKKEKKVKEKKVKEKPVQQSVQQVADGYGPKPVSVIGWIGLILLRLIPLGAIIELVIALSSSNPTLRNYGKAKLILIIIMVVLIIVGFIMLLPVIQDVYDNIYDMIDLYR